LISNHDDDDDDDDDGNAMVVTTVVLIAIRSFRNRMLPIPARSEASLFTIQCLRDLTATSGVARIRL
jgi:hypothetical protein